MKPRTFGIAALITFLISTLFQSCLDNDEKDYSQLTIGTIKVKEEQDYYFQLDAGGKMYPGDTTQINNYEVKDEQRSFIYFDLLDEKIPGYEYNAIIYRIENILTKDIERIPDNLSEKEAGNDHINITNLWLTENHVNIQYQLRYDKQSDKKHLLTLAVNENSLETAEENNEYLNLEFRHNAYNEKDNGVGSGLVSYKLKNIHNLIQGKKGLNIRYHSLYDGVRYKKVDFSTK